MQVFIFITFLFWSDLQFELEAPFIRTVQLTIYYYQERDVKIMKQIVAVKVQFKILRRYNLNRMSKPEQLIAFLKKYTLNYIDAHTAIIVEQEPSFNFNFNILTEPNNKLNQSSLAEIDQFLSRAKNDKGKDKSCVNLNSNSMPTCYLVKDMILQDLEGGQNGQGQILKNVLQTLMMHQQLANKYLLSLIHHEIFIKNIHVQSQQSPRKAYQTKQVQHRTQLQSSTYSNNSMESQPFGAFHPKRATTHPQQSEAQISRNSESLIEQPRTAIRAIYQYGKLTLKQQIGNRIASNTQFQEEELWAIMAAVAQALGYLQQQGIVYGVLGADKIFINNSLVKVLDPSATATDPLLIAEGRLYSPQILNDEENINMFKSDIYIVGLVLIQCGLLLDLSKQPEPNICNYLSVFRQNYSGQLAQILEMCLVQHPDQRPTFQDLLKYLQKQLDMADFQGAYDTTSSKILKPLPCDEQDFCNPQVSQIQYEYQQANYDILYESVNQEQQPEYKKRSLTDFQKAKIKYLGSIGSQSRKTNPRSSTIKQKQIERDRKQGIKSQQKHKKSSTSPLQTRRNSQTYHNQVSNPSRLPGLNMAISESVYTDEIIPITSSNRDKTNRKGSKRQGQKNDYHLSSTISRQQKQNNCDGENQKSGMRMSQNVKKTKMIKEKLVRNNENQENEHTFGAIKKSQQKRKHFHSNNRQEQYNFIKEEAEEESESSLIYHNLSNNSKVSKNHQSVSQFSNNSQKMQSSLSRSSARYQQQNCMRGPLYRTKTRVDQQQLFTDPNLMQTIKEDLARISTTKNTKLQAGNNEQDRRWFK